MFSTKDASSWKHTLKDAFIEVLKTHRHTFHWPPYLVLSSPTEKIVLESLVFWCSFTKHTVIPMHSLSFFLAHYCPTHSRTCSKAGLLKINSSWYTRLLATNTGNDITLIKRSIFSPRRTVATQSRFLRNAARDWAASFINKFADPLHDSAAGETAN